MLYFIFDNYKPGFIVEYHIALKIETSSCVEKNSGENKIK